MSMFEVPLSISSEYFPMINDLFRMGIIQIVTQLMFYFSNPLENPFWSPMFVQTVVFLLIGVLAYWLVFRHIISVVPEEAAAASASAGERGGVGAGESQSKRDTVAVDADADAGAATAVGLIAVDK
jgi:hypothetical protein